MQFQELKRKMPEIFEKVKKDVRKVWGRHRAGLNLVLEEMGIPPDGFIGAMHYHPGTEIRMNKTPLRLILKTQPYEIVWAYTYHILLHEYVHSLGIIDEEKCRAITLKISEDIFKEADHPAIILAKRGIGAYIPNLKTLSDSERRPDGILIEYVKDFDIESQSYFS